ncbi:3-oxoadipate enol-lactonase [Haloactinospora alba]|uniref:3-oxoadipate enol-lactonase n=1 Tax=Haloactinospora alba TaxID=405555 RepID=A0A543NGZ6_9ACTN|nr:3-oxoadipate enol-lactonase [Haloactinospora alba]TQN31125.1 3-oxoadipate enol-lactonase [Haloactinospora alba]
MSVDVHYSVEGPEDGPVVLLAGSLGSTAEMWQHQLPALTGAGFRVVRYDLRGHGSSPVPEGPSSIADIGGDALRLLDRLGADRAHLVGLSIGGMAGMWVAANAPERIGRLALLCTSAWYGDPEGWSRRAATVREHGVGAVADAVVERWFTPGFARRSPEVVERMRATVADTSPQGYASCCAAIADMDLRGQLSRITAPTLVIAGAEDEAAPPGHAESIAAGIRDSRLRIVDGAAHLANWEQAGTVNELLLDHLRLPSGGTPHTT